ncbi:MAG: type II toxin-antitoxin system VapC family toxin [Hyphomonadaceae bacterium]|nr:type II toxin-antitoxin system VapC family toxin [Hyphomonadaceae bacterium]
MLGYGKAQQCIRLHQDRAISVITFIEVLAGAIPEDEQKVRAFLTRFNVVQTNPKIAEFAISIRRNSSLKFPDSLILATAQFERRTLFSRDQRMISIGLKVPCLNPYEL